jgi:hypothetical protein
MLCGPYLVLANALRVSYYPCRNSVSKERSISSMRPKPIVTKAEMALDALSLHRGQFDRVHRPSGESVNVIDRTRPASN